MPWSVPSLPLMCAVRPNSDQRDDGVGPRLAHVGFDRGDRAVEGAEQIGKPALHSPFIDVRVPAIEGQCTDARAVRPGEELRRRAGGLGEIGAHLGDAAGLHRRAAVGRPRIHAAGMGDCGDTDTLLKNTGEGRVGVAVQIE